MAWASNALFGIRDRHVVDLGRRPGEPGRRPVRHAVAGAAVARRGPARAARRGCHLRRAPGPGVRQGPRCRQARHDERRTHRLPRRHGRAAAGLRPLRPAVGRRPDRVRRPARRSSAPASARVVPAPRADRRSRWCGSCVSRDGTRLVAQVAARAGATAWWSRGSSATPRAGSAPSGRRSALPLTGVGSPQIRDLGWRTPGSLAVLTAPTAATSQVLVVKIDGSSTPEDLEHRRGAVPGQAVPAGHLARARARRSTSAPRPGSCSRWPPPVAGPARASGRDCGRRPSSADRPGSRPPAAPAASRPPPRRQRPRRPCGPTPPWPVCRLRAVLHRRRPDLLLGSACVGCGRTRTGAVRGLRRVVAPARSRRLAVTDTRAGWPCPAPRGRTTGCSRSLVNAAQGARRARPRHAAGPGAVRRGARPARRARPRAGRGTGAARAGAVARARWSGAAATTRCSAPRAAPPHACVAPGVDAAVRRLLVPAGRVRDQSTLNAADRAANLAGSMSARRPRPADVRARVLLVDDVLTTGSTAREAQRALEQRGLRVAGHGHGGRDPTAHGVDRPSGSWGFPTVLRARALTSLYGVRPGPWLRRGRPERGRGRSHHRRPDPPGTVRLADASRRQNGPRKTYRSARPTSSSAAPVRRSRCGLEVSPAPHPPSDTAGPGEKAGSGREAAEASAGDCGVEDQVGRTGSTHVAPFAATTTGESTGEVTEQSGGCRWTSCSTAGTAS